jgi:hypothetical protein
MWLNTPGCSATSAFFRFHYRSRSSWRKLDGHFAWKRRGFHFVVKEKSMRNARAFLGATLFLAAMACAALTVSGPTTTAGERRAAIGNHWRHHDGRWSYWDNGDRRWYYTDGSNWFYNNGNNGDAWNVYRFDKGFGKDGFERGDYKVPAAGTNIETPKHGIYQAPAK